MITGYVYVNQDGTFLTTPNTHRILVYLDKPSPSNQHSMSITRRTSLKLKKVSIKILNAADGE